MKKLGCPSLYFFISYEKLKSLLLEYSQIMGCSIVDGFAQQEFDQRGFALIDDKLSPSIVQKIAAQIPVICFSAEEDQSLAIANVSPQITYAQFKNLMSDLINQSSILNLEDILIGRSASWKAVVDLVQLASQKDCTVLIQGESGTGKEVVAKTIHKLSHRAKLPFMPVNCGAIPPDLVESELFGHEKGAFTGAINHRLGKFEVTQGGTLFLDEIGDMPLNMQVKLLRVIQEREFERVGSNKFIPFSGRIISATHYQLKDMVCKKSFREDLFYRLNVLPIYLPSLRERKEDIEILIKRIIERDQLKIEFSKNAIEILTNYDWPGNVRQLINLLERAEVFFQDKLIQPEQVQELLKYELIYTCF